MRYWARWKSQLSPWPGLEKPETVHLGVCTTTYLYQTYLHGPSVRDIERQIRSSDPNVTELLVLLARMSGLR